MEQIRCDCHFKNVVAEKDNEAVYVQCRGCKEKVKIEPDKDFWCKLGETVGAAVRDYLLEHNEELPDNLK